MGKGEVYLKEATTLYLIDIKRIINYSLFLLTGGIWDVPCELILPEYLLGSSLSPYFFMHNVGF
jgi:hypothetical protein